MNPTLQWDQIHSQLWMQIMSPAQSMGGEHSGSDHVVCIHKVMQVSVPKWGRWFKIIHFARSSSPMGPAIGRPVPSTLNAPYALDHIPYFCA